MKIVPYLSFQGNCEEALGFYNAIFDGEVIIEQRYDVPEMQAPEEYQDKVLHASLQFGDNMILASDTFPGQKARKAGGSVSLSILIDEREEGKRIFDALSEAGMVHHPYEKQFWGDWHGNLTDKYGIRWMVNFESK